ncbi:hypothetical protein D3C76_1323980 [compost metagenome]
MAASATPRNSPWAPLIRRLKLMRHSLLANRDRKGRLMNMPGSLLFTWDWKYSRSAKLPFLGSREAESATTLPCWSSNRMSPLYGAAVARSNKAR